MADKQKPKVIRRKISVYNKADTDKLLELKKTKDMLEKIADKVDLVIASLEESK